MSVICTICMRGGSKGIPNKNLKPINGKPLLFYTVKHAIESKLFEHVVVSTDSKEIANEAKKYGAKAWFLRPKNLASDYAAKIPVIRHALLESELYFKKNFEVIVDLDATSPLRNIEDIDKALNKFFDEKCDNLFSVCKSRKNPYFNVVEDSNGINLVKKIDNKIVRRQEAPVTYDINASIYIWKRDSLLKSDTLFSKNTSIYIMPQSRSIDIDSMFEWEFVENILRRRES